jgi:hypothetical protein
MLTPTSNVVILGFGTRAVTFAALLAPRGCALRAWDPLLAGADGARQRARIEAAGVDAIPELPAAMRGARLVVLDSAPDAVLAQVQLVAGQTLLNLATAPATEIQAVLVALGLPPAAAHWETACTATAAAVADSAAMTAEAPAIPRGELP